MTSARIEIAISDVRWDGPVSMTTVAVLASVVADLRITVRGTIVLDYPTACIVDILDFLLQWRESTIPASATYDGGIENEGGFLSIVKISSDEWWVGSEASAVEAGPTVGRDLLTDAIDRFADVVRTEFHNLTGASFEEWSRDHPSWRRT